MHNLNGIFDPEPEVALSNTFERPYDVIVAAARTCYSPKVITPEDVSKDEKARALRDRIYDSIYEAGHHTTIQHPTFQFALKRVSRQFIWSFLHSHPFYNSEQVSQRYVEVRPENFVTPPLSGNDREIYLQTVRKQMEGYLTLIKLIVPDVEKEYYRIYPARRRQPEKWKAAIHKKVLEHARYVLPVATQAHLYHTISGITLHRYHKISQQMDTPTETRAVVQKMIEEVTKVDPLFFHRIEDPIPLEETPEHRMFDRFHRGMNGEGTRAFIRQFDSDLGPYRSKLIDYKVNGVRTMADAVRSTLGLTRESMSDAEAIDCVTNPARNAYLPQSLVLTTHSKLSRAMNHPHFTFQKKLSHTADSQDQRHRMVPGGRPVLATHFRADEPDVLMPRIIEKNTAASEFFLDLMKNVWTAMEQLMNEGAPWEYAQYLLPNATAIRFEESGDLLHLHHKWTTRLCYLAQEEIWRCCLEEVKQVREIQPDLARHLVAPCGIRERARQSPYCPEGNRFCGVRVWELDLNDYARLM